MKLALILLLLSTSTQLFGNTEETKMACFEVSDECYEIVALSYNSLEQVYLSQLTFIPPVLRIKIEGIESDLQLDSSGDFNYVCKALGIKVWGDIVESLGAYIDEGISYESAPSEEITFSIDGAGKVKLLRNSTQVFKRLDCSYREKPQTPNLYNGNSDYWGRRGSQTSTGGSWTE
ncbi:MAG: hypothetical protein HOE90_02580 [Bacteriovoracaceae bacterium]|jgi:hypothetical protein|nr:hypothetical protein [Bacteriovoracaceae bacterium]